MSAEAFGTLIRMLGWHLGSRLVPGEVVVPFVADTRLLVGPGQHAVTGVVHTGLPELADMAFVLHLLRPGDLFLDVGANVGTYTVLASGVCGATSIALEPVSETFRRLEDNLALNRLGLLVEALQVAAGSTDGRIAITTDRDTMNHVVTGAVEGQVSTVPLRRIDSLLAGRGPTCIKIDVEGWEMEALRGALEALGSPSLLGMVIETNGSGRRYGVDQGGLHAWLLDELGFSACRYEPLARELIPLGRGWNQDAGNTIYVRDLTRAARRVATASSHTVRGVRL